MNYEPSEARLAVHKFPDQPANDQKESRARRRGTGVGGRQGCGGASIHHSGKSDAVVRTFISIDFFEAVAVDARAWVSRGL